MVAVAVLGFAGTGAVAQGVSFSGSGDLGVKYAGDTKEDGVVTMNSTITWVSNFDLAMSASGTTDGGLTFGAGATVKAGNAKSEVGKSNAYIGGESWKISIGDLDPASIKGQSLGDIGFDGLDVDDVAEDVVGATAADVEVSFSLGAASLAITAGQTPGAPRELISAGNDGGSKQMTRIYAITPISDFAATPATQDRGMRHIGTITEDGSFTVTLPGTDDEIGTADDVKNTFYLDDGAVTIVNGDARDNDENGETDDAAATATDLGLSATERLVQEVDEDVPAMDAVYKAATKQETEWAAGVSFDIGSTTLGIGIDSEKLMQASVSADLGAFSGKLFYAQQKMNEGKDNESKATGLGVEIGVSAGENTTINAVYAQGKTDYEKASMSDKTDKGFGVGVSHGLGGGATLNAGFAKVKKVTKASVGVSMSF